MVHGLTLLEENMLESLIEQHLVKEVNRRDGLCLKFNSQSMTGIPDRIILMKNGTVGFVEVKQKGKKYYINKNFSSNDSSVAIGQIVLTLI